MVLVIYKYTINCIDIQCFIWCFCFSWYWYYFKKLKNIFFDCQLILLKRPDQNYFFDWFYWRAFSPDSYSFEAVRFDEHKWETVDLSACVAPDSVKIPTPYLHFSHLMNAYAKYYNKRTGRHGNLFERPFKRKIIENQWYLKGYFVHPQ